MSRSDRPLVRGALSPARLLVPVLALSAVGAWAAAATLPATAVAAPVVAAPVEANAVAVGMSDVELRAQLARWQELPTEDRRLVLTELRRRGIAVSVVAETRERFGYRVVQADGSVVEVSRQVRIVRIGQGVPDAGFGVGFEHRVAPPAERATTVADDQGWRP